MPASPEFDPDQLHDEIAELRGLTDRMGEVIGTPTATPTQVQGTLVATDPVNGGPETWHAATTGNGWTGTLNYRLAADGLSVMLSALLVPGTLTNNTVIVTLPAGYRPAGTHSWPVRSNGSYSGSVAAVLLNTSGQIQCLGMAATGATIVDWEVTSPLDI